MIELMELLATRLILALLQDDPCERDFRVRQVRDDAGLDPSRFVLALATAEEAARWWGHDPEHRDLARAMLTARIEKLAGVAA